MSVTNEQNYKAGGSTKDTMSVIDEIDVSIHQRYILSVEVWCKI